jgi:hypothetical protein
MCRATLPSSALLGEGLLVQPQGYRFNWALECMLCKRPVVVNGAGSVLFGPRWSGTSWRILFITAWVSSSEPADGPR